MEMTDEEVTAHFPVKGWRQRCGNRKDRPPEERKHDYVELGLDVRNGAEAGFIHGFVSACFTCGADKFTGLRGPRLSQVEKFLGRKLLPEPPPKPDPVARVELNADVRAAEITLPDGRTVKVFRTGRVEMNGVAL